jgi:hypothetical protein
MAFSRLRWKAAAGLAGALLAGAWLSWLLYRSRRRRPNLALWRAGALALQADELGPFTQGASAAVGVNGLPERSPCLAAATPSDKREGALAVDDQAGPFLSDGELLLPDPEAAPRVVLKAKEIAESGREIGSASPEISSPSLRQTFDEAFQKTFHESWPAPILPAADGIVEPRPAMAPEFACSASQLMLPCAAVLPAPNREQERGGAPETPEYQEMAFVQPLFGDEFMPSKLLPPLERTKPGESSSQKANAFAAPPIGDSSLRVFSRRIGRRLLRAIDAVLSLLLAPVVHRKIRWITAAVALAAIVSHSSSMRPAMEKAAAAAIQPLRQREAFTWQESFHDGTTTWVPSSALAPTEEGEARVKGLVLYTKAMGFKNYGVDFSARLDRRSIGWVVRASDPQNYFVFKLVERGRSPQGLKFDLIRYAVTGGRAPSPAERQVVPVIVIGSQNRFLNISCRVTDDQIVTLVNGFGVDTWKHPEVRSGSVGFLAEDGDSFLVRSLTISGNDDFWGLFLWGAEQTFRDLRQATTHMLRPKGV